MFARRQSHWFLILTVTSTLAWGLSPVYARGGRGGGRPGGGPPGGQAGAAGRPTPGPGAHPGNGPAAAGQFQHAAGPSGRAPGFASAEQLQGAFQQARSAAPQQVRDQLAQNAQNLADQAQNRSQPFSPAWYAQHPQAWQATHPHAGAAVVVSTAAVSAWLGGAYAADSGSSGGNSYTTVYESEPTSEQLPAGVAANVSEAAGTDDEWAILGTFSLAPAADKPATLMVQLAIDHQGTVRGVHYHAASNTMNNVIGSIDTINEQVQWRLESNQQLWFQTPLSDLLAGSAQVQVTMPTGIKQWYLKRVELPTAEQE